MRFLRVLATLRPLPSPCPHPRPLSRWAGEGGIAEFPNIGRLTWWSKCSLVVVHRTPPVCPPRSPSPCPSPAERERGFVLRTFHP